MRGTLEVFYRLDNNPRFIPAHAGNTLLLGGNQIYTPVHPRACGEHVIERCIFLDKDGSSPRMRGTHRIALSQSFADRFIPAHAGNTQRCERPEPAGTVHPRACGEHSTATAAAIRNSGSSPRMRGTLVSNPGISIFIRFIPAHAGNTLTPNN